MLTNPEIHKSNLNNKPLYFEGGRIGVQNARIGSVVFSGFETVGVFINSLRLMDTDNVIYGIFNELVMSLLWFGMVLLFGIALSTFPAFWGGNLLFVVGQRKSNPRPISRWWLISFGAILGLFAGLLISLLVFTFDYYFMFLNSHNSLFAESSPITTIFLMRAGVATFIATLTGVWTGKQIVESLSKGLNF